MKFQASARALLVVALFVAVGLAPELCPSFGMSTVPPGGNVAHVIAPGESHDNGDINVVNDSNSRGTAREDPWSGAENSTTTTVTTGQQFQGSISGMDGQDSLSLGSRSGTESNPVQVTGSSGSTTMGSDTWAHFHNSGTNGTLTVRDVAGNTLASFGPGEGGTVHHP